MARLEGEPGYVEKGSTYLAVGGLFLALAGVAISEEILINLGIIAIIAGLAGWFISREFRTKAA